MGPVIKIHNEWRDVGRPQVANCHYLQFFLNFYASPCDICLVDDKMMTVIVIIIIIIIIIIMSKIGASVAVENESVRKQNVV